MLKLVGTSKSDTRGFSFFRIQIARSSWSNSGGRDLPLGHVRAWQTRPNAVILAENLLVHASQDLREPLLEHEFCKGLAYFFAVKHGRGFLDVFKFRGHLVNEYSDFTRGFTRIKADEIRTLVDAQHDSQSSGLNRWFRAIRTSREAAWLRTSYSPAIRTLHTQTFSIRKDGCFSRALSSLAKQT